MNTLIRLVGVTHRGYDLGESGVGCDMNMGGERREGEKVREGVRVTMRGRVCVPVCCVWGLWWSHSRGI